MKKLLICLLSLLLLQSSLYAAEQAKAADKDAQKKEHKKNGKSLFWEITNGKQEAYLFSYFKGRGDGLHFAYSFDGLIWKSVQNDKIFLKPQVGKEKLMRDPSIVQGPDGLFHMVWTSGWKENNIGYAYSEDLIHWSEQQEIPVMAHEAGCRNTWAPELFYDKASKKYYIVWASTIEGKFEDAPSSEDQYNHRLYYTTTKDFKTFAPTQLFYDPGFNVIDACILKEGGKYRIFLKNETLDPVEKNIRMVSTNSLKKIPLNVSEPISGKEWAEGPSAIKIGKYTYVYWDLYRNHRYTGVRSKNPKKGQWEKLDDKIKFPAGMRHGTAFCVDESVVYKLLETE